MIRILSLFLFIISYIMGNIVDVNDTSYRSIITDNNRTVLLFHAPWCGSCKSFEPIFYEVSKDIKGVLFGSVNTDKNDVISNKFGIKSIPVTILFENGKEVDRAVGAMNKESLIVFIDSNKILDNYNKLCMKGDGDSCMKIAHLYMNESLSFKDYEKTLFYYKEACKLGKMKGCAYVGDIYSTGEFRDKNYTIAQSFYIKACDYGDGKSCSDIADNYYEGKNGLKVDLIKAKEMFEKGCEDNYAYSCYSLAYMYENAEGTKGDQKRAEKLYKIACDGGYKNACKDSNTSFIKSGNSAVDDDSVNKYFLPVFVVLFYLFVIIMHFKQKRVVLKNSEFPSITEKVPFLFSWSMFMFGFFVPLFRNKGRVGFAIGLLILQIVTAGWGALIWAFFYNKQYIKNLLTEGYEPIDETTKILLASKNIIDSSDIDPNKLIKKRNIFVTILINLIKFILIGFAFVILSLIISETIAVL